MVRFALLALLAACASAPAPAVTPPSNTPTGDLPPPAPRPIAGDYHAPHEIMVVCDGGDDGWCEEEVQDTMTVRDAGPGQIAVTIELVQTNAHTCTFEGTLTAAAPDGAARRWTHSSENEEGPCAVTLTALDTTLDLTSEGCRYYCGARAHLEASFPFPPVAP